MTNTVANEICKYISNLTATNPICVALGTTFTEASNLFLGIEQIKDVDSLTVIPYGGSPPTVDRHESAVQIRVKSSSNSRSLRMSQATINVLHGNDSVCASAPGKVFAQQSSPIILGYLEGGDYCITVSNYIVKHVKL